MSIIKEANKTLNTLAVFSITAPRLTSVVLVDEPRILDSQQLPPGRNCNDHQRVVDYLICPLGILSCTPHCHIFGHHLTSSVTCGREGGDY